MRTIFKYEILIKDGVQRFDLPNGFTIPHIGEQDGKLMMWIDQDTDNKNRPFLVRVFGTGHNIGDEWANHIQTVQMSTGLVWHIYQV